MSGDLVTARVRRRSEDKRDAVPVEDERVEAARDVRPPVISGVAAELLGTVQRRGAAVEDPLGGQPVDDGVAHALSRRAGGGQPLPRPLAQAMGEQLGHDLSGVRVHNDTEASTLARSVQATAFTVGSDIYFGEGAYAPGSRAGQHLLAHELTHVVQQGSGAQRSIAPVPVAGLSAPTVARSAAPVIGRADDPAEHEADRVADEVMRALSSPGASAGAAHDGAAHDGAAHDHAQCAPSGVQHALHRKMWDSKRFTKATNESWWTKQGSAQKALIDMIEGYRSTYEAHGVVAPDQTAEALNSLLQMRQITKWWIDDHTIEVQDGTGGATKTLDDPDRPKRLVGFRAFSTFLDDEIATLQKSQKDAGKDVTQEITEKSPGFLKMEKKYTGDAKSLFEKLGGLIEKAVPHNGDSTEIEVEVKFPVDPHGVGYLGGRFKASVEKDENMVKLRGELAITGGADVEWAEIGGELGGYLESQASNGADAMALISYALFRRIRESHVIPDEIGNYLWGGNTGDFGKAKAEKWSLDLEKRIFDAYPDPDPAEFAKRFPDPTKCAEELAKAQEVVDKKREKVYVETGGLVGAKASADAKIVKGEASIGYTEGRKIDFTSLKNRKGGAGEKNLKSDSFIAAGARALSGGTRGAQKSVGRSVRSLNTSAKLEFGLGEIGSVGGEVNLGLGWESDGMSVTRTGTKPTTKMSKCELEIAVAAGIKLADLVGPVGDKIFGYISDKLIAWMRSKLLPEIQAQDEPGAGDVVQAASIEASALSSVTPSHADSVQQLAKVEGGTGIKISVKMDAVEGGASIEIRKTSETKVEVPKLLEAKLSRSSRIVKFTKSGTGWEAS